MWGEVSECERTGAEADCGAGARYTLSMFLFYVKCGPELDVCYLSPEVQCKISAAFFTACNSVGKSVQKMMMLTFTCLWVGQYLAFNAFLCECIFMPKIA